METWNNVELADLSKKSYTLNHDYDTVRKVIVNHNNNEEVVVDASAAAEGQQATNGDGTLQPGSDIKPKVKAEDVESLLRRLYGITIAEIKELISYDDRNYFLKEDLNIKNPLIPTHCPHGYVLKILNSLDSKKTDFVDAQNQLMIYLANEGIQCPRPIANVNGKHYSVEFINGAHYVVRLLEYVPGKIFHEVEATNYLLYQSGEFLANIDRSLKHFNHVAYDTHKSTWQLQAVPKLSEFMYVIKDHARKTLCEEIIAAFEQNVLSKLDQLPQQIIHGDFNEQNVVVNPKSSGDSSAEYRVTGIIDFGDTNKSPLIFEIAIAMTYMMLQAKSLVGGGIFLAGYTLNNPISQEEKGYLKYCIAARLAQSLIMGAYTHSLDPTNDYVLATQDEGWKLINELWREQFENVDEMWQMAGDKYLTQSVK